MDINLIRKYNIPGPRYTSYPTVPYWDEASFTTEKWIDSVNKIWENDISDRGISVYIHLPFCESLCTFCACHKRITKQHSVEASYIETIIKEWKLYAALLNKKIKIRELHLGGGTPTFFSPASLERLLTQLFSMADIDTDAEFSFEGHPNSTTVSHLETLYKYGFRRVSFGVQDYDPKVQKSINRIQPFEQVQFVTNAAREAGYKSISHDLIFGLPFQTRESMSSAIDKTMQLKPGRISFYSYAHVPWVKGVGQRGFDENDLPSPVLKRELYEMGKMRFEEAGYIETGMDHFALPDDSLYTAMQNKTLHRNFMGYTNISTKLMIGLGMSAISDSWYAFAQNDKSLEAYTDRVNRGLLPVFRGHLLNEEDLIIRKHILNIMCRMETSWQEENMQTGGLENILERLQEPEADGLIEIMQNGIRVTGKGIPFVRNIAMAFDLRLIRDAPQTQLFSMTI